MEGKEARFGIANSALWAAATTAASNGSVNSMHDSFTPLGGLVPMWLMQLGEVIFGGVGSGLYGMLIFAIIAVFVAGLMVGRTPEYLGKKIEAYEMKMASLVILIPPAIVLLGTAVAVVTDAGRATIYNLQPGAARLQRDPVCLLVRRQQQRQCLCRAWAPTTSFYNTALGLAMFVCPLLACHSDAGDRRLTGAQEDTCPPSAGTLPTHTPLFVAAADRHRHDRRRPDVRPGAGAGTDRRTFHDG